MKKISVKTIPGLVLTSSLVGLGAFVLATRKDVNNSYASEISNKETLNYTEKRALESEQNLVGIENKEEIEKMEAKVESANQEVSKAESVKKEADEAVKKAENLKEEAETELKNAKTEEEIKIAQEKVTKAEKTLKKATKVQEEAQTKVEEATKVKESGQAKVEQVTKTVEEAKEEKKSVETQNQNVNTVKETQPKQTTAAKQVEETNRKTVQSKTTTTNNEEGGAAKQRELSAEDWDVINKALQDEHDRLEREGKLPEVEEHNVEFHFYSTIKDLKVRRNGDDSLWSHCGNDGVNCIWFVEFSCDMNECEGFAEPGTNALSGKVLIGRRGDTTEYVMQPPKAKPGYKFKAWEMVSVHGEITQYGETGVLVSKYRAVYEKC